MKTIIKYKHGDVREDGMVFWVSIRKKEYWVTKEKFCELDKVFETKLENKDRVCSSCNRHKNAFNSLS
jgi:hypothetical protein